jgi:hypothetical protein
LHPPTPHRAHARSLSLDASAPHLIMSGVSAMGALCRQAEFAQCTHSQGAMRRVCSSVSGASFGMAAQGQPNHLVDGPGGADGFACDDP